MFRAALAHNHVARLRQVPRLRQFLERALEIGHRRLNVGAGLFVALERRVEHVAENKSARGVGAAIQIHRCDERLQGIHQQGFLGTSAAHFFAAAQFQETADFEPARHAVQVGEGADQLGFLAREIAFVEPGIALHQRFGDEKSQHRIAQKLQLFVIVQRGGRSAIPRFVRQGTVSQRAVQQLRVEKPVVDSRFQRWQLRART